MHEVLNVVAVDFVHVIPDLDPLNIRLAVGIQLQHTEKHTVSIQTRLEC